MRKYLTIYALIKKNRKFSSYLRKFRVEQLQSYMTLQPIPSEFLIYQENLIFISISVVLIIVFN
jgi:hypothetical protein